MKNWYDDIDQKSVERACEVLPQIELPNPGDPPIYVALNEEPRAVETKELGDMMVCNAVQLSPNKIEGTIILPKSMRFNMAKSIARTDKDFRKVKLTGKTFKLWSIMDGSQKYYQAELWVQTTMNGDDS